MLWTVKRFDGVSNSLSTIAIIIIISSDSTDYKFFHKFLSPYYVGYAMKCFRKKVAFSWRLTSGECSSIRINPSSVG